MTTNDGHYTLLEKVKQGGWVDGRERLGKTCNTFIRWLKQPYKETWNSLQEARLAMDLPMIVFFFSMPMLNESGNLLSDYKWAHDRMERLITQIADLAEKKPGPKVPSLQQWIKEYESKGKKK
jgi:hypothetical protein